MSCWSPFPCCLKKQESDVCHLKMTVMLLPNRTAKITGIDIDTAMFDTDKVLSEEVTKVLATSLSKKKKKKKKKAAAAE